MTFGDPVTAQPGATPKSPLITLGPVLVTVEPPRTAKLSAVPRSTDDCAACTALARGLSVALSCARPVSVGVELLARALLELLARVVLFTVLGVELLARVLLCAVLRLELLARVLLRVVLGVELRARVLFFTVLRVKLLARVREAVVRVDSPPLGAGLLLLAAESVLEAETVLSDARDCEATAASPSTTSPSTSPRSTAGHLERACLVAARAWAFMAASFLVPGLSGAQGVLEGRGGGPGGPNPH